MSVRPLVRQRVESVGGLTQIDPVLSLPERRLLRWIVGSAAVGILVGQSSTLATLHGAVTIAAVGFAAGWSRRPPVVLALLVYGGLSDVLWRATGARVPWEGSKYLVIIVALTALVRFAPRPGRIGTPLVYLVALGPGALTTLLLGGFGESRDVLAFALLGPCALAVATLLFRQFVLTRAELRGLVWWAMSPCMSVAAFAAWGTIQADTISFGDESMFVTSGGFGPNQVSTMIGLGALCAVIVAVLGAPRRVILVVAIVGVAMVAQALITLSRGGVYAFALAAVAILLSSLLLNQRRSRAVVALAAVCLLGLLALNWAQSFSGGAVGNRFDQNDAGRGTIASAEVELFRHNPVFGVGAGRAKFEREVASVGDPGLEAYADAASHNEYSRLLAEHGSFGLLAIVLLVVMVVQAFARGTDPLARSISVGLFVWSAAAMAHSATRLAAVGLVFGLASVRVDSGLPRRYP